MKKNLIAILFALLVVVGLVGCGGDETKPVPDVTGQSMSQAVETLQDAGFYLQTFQTPAGNKAFGGTVTRQSPEAGSEQPTYTKITMTVESDMEIQKREFEKDMKKAAKKRAKEEKARKAKEDRVKRVADEIRGTNAMQAIERLEQEHMSGRITTNNGIKEDELKQTIKEYADMGIDWVVTEATPRMSGDDGVVDITVDTKARADAANAAKEQSDRLEGKLSMGAAFTACEEYGRHQYPAGFKAHAFSRTAAPADDNTWSVRMTVDVTNMYGAEMKDLTCVCKVTGTTASPQVVDFTVQ